MQEVKKPISLVRPTTETPFHLDFDWWRESDANWRIFLFEFLCEKHQESFKDKADTVKIDAIDPVTAEVKTVDGFLHELINHCAKQPDFINESMPMVAQIFRIFLSNSNKPLSSDELSAIINRPARTILATLTGPQIYKGIRQYTK
ncbi:MAG: hypothetical protein FJZ98_01150 [Chloroflexi bacterium]|nr:hypothetical protein [Chloroflexota bacterium]